MKIIFKKLQIKNINVYYKFSMYISRNPFLLSKSSFTFILLKNLSLLGIKKKRYLLFKNLKLLHTAIYFAKYIRKIYNILYSWKKSLKLLHTVTYSLSKSLKNSKQYIKKILWKSQILAHRYIPIEQVSEKLETLFLNRCNKSKKFYIFLKKKKYFLFESLKLSHTATYSSKSLKNSRHRFFR